MNEENRIEIARAYFRPNPDINIDMYGLHVGNEVTFLPPNDISQWMKDTAAGDFVGSGTYYNTYCLCKKSRIAEQIAFREESSEYLFPGVRVADVSCIWDIRFFKEFWDVFKSYDFRCATCGEPISLETGSIIDDKCYCDVCITQVDNVHFCNRCEHYVSGNEWNNKFNRCNDCCNIDLKEIYGRVLSYHGFDDWIPCYGTNENKNNQRILTGVELEVEHATAPWDTPESDVVLKLNTMLGCNTICSHDGSINDGFEIVSQPFTLKYMREHEEIIKNALRYLIGEGYRGDQVSTCGLHVHISRCAFGITSDEQSENIDKLILFFETYKSQLINFSRRRGNSLSHWAKFLSDYYHVDTNKETTKSKKMKSLAYIKRLKGDVDSKYIAVNLNHHNTVEIRIFKSTLNYKTFFATLELVHTLVRHIIRSESVEDLTWESIIDDPDNKYLKEYADLRNIHTDVGIIDYTSELKAVSDIRLKASKQSLIERYETVRRIITTRYKRLGVNNPIFNWFDEHTYSVQDGDDIDEQFNTMISDISTILMYVFGYALYVNVEDARYRLDSYYYGMPSYFAHMESVDFKCITKTNLRELLTIYSIYMREIKTVDIFGEGM